MPKYSAKQQTVAALKKSRKIRKFVAKEKKKSDKLLKNISEVLEEEVDAELEKIAVVKDLEQNLQANRYLHKGGNTLPKLKSKEEKLAFLEDLDADGFKEEIRMFKSMFNKLYEIIKDHSLYKSPKGHKQTDAQTEMLYPIAGLHEDLVLEGSVLNFTVFFFKIMLSMENMYVFWPSELEKTATIIPSNEKPFGFPDLVGFLDGYFGSMNNARVFEESIMGSDPNNFFSGDQYVLVNASYIPKMYVVHVIKKPKNKELCDADKAFNSYIAMTKIKIEHAFGILKERFFSFKRLPIKIRSRKDMDMVNSWIRVCVILHNFLIDQTDDMMTMTMKIS
ncbi:hypothetical protein PHYBLDRAFT_63040 [Phycomyces blakesleeanus NRRL 1555(-)]|uniref:DDE Tnp4 domain-containing protein n=1 Tax=Phycomyces blakesleeanus (strain ATCC 8743b / DSM 1359 / FGSC 10004 / NBRC 33097 / NRRL 1555) TaxID=763407 RepID=A0A167NWK4_PHYB8|nr:hypothetical protein PHYBLDRAFT_63040 [Phycomyces blakesleeanus NRRL 1555(-)]OAD76758.1 hypothetical protein PHYBLDRAFT_63040 [Phycomyces blakesleeanus NRRL 1555(-)]|eukprot:XP_018294798.1 hypothetical protein PHYBLDRAFT_63040 [Phycomyces blakesleeanus NRRL 1555(-)]